MYHYFWRILGTEQVRVLGPDITAYTVEGLQPDESVIVGVAPVSDSQVGDVVTITTRTSGYVGTVTGLRIVDVSSNRIRISWSPVSRATGYKITWERDDGKQIFMLNRYIAAYKCFKKCQNKSCTTCNAFESLIWHWFYLDLL